MSSYYHIDIHTNPLANSRIVDVVESVTGSTTLSGSCVVRVPDYVGVKDPVDLPDLITKKYLGLLAFYAGFQYITYDDLLEAADVDFAAPGLRGLFGERGSISIPPNSMGGQFESITTVLSGAAPTQAVLAWEAYHLNVSDPSGSRLQRVYQEASASDLTCQVSFNGGATYLSATDGTVLSIPVLSQGTNFRIRFVNASGNRVYIGSWAVLY